MQKWRTLAQSVKRQIYVSRSRDPILNLSIEHFLLQESHPDSTILFLYVNRPCVVIGRNQNPWLEVNLNSVKPDVNDGDRLSPSDVQFVRRRSGGGTVFHDEGNVNYCVICHPNAFTRDKHAEMVTRAIRAFNDRARVNERHDIVLDQGPELESATIDRMDMHRTTYDNFPGVRQPLKVSGSAYKLIRNRALHHGTCLVASPNLKTMSRYLTSPAGPYLKVRGVESVRSPIGNILPSALPKPHVIHPFQESIVAAFSELYGIPAQETTSTARKIIDQHDRHSQIYENEQWAIAVVSEDLSELESVSEGIKELKSPKWLYDQTPQFSLESQIAASSGNKTAGSGPFLVEQLPESVQVNLLVKGGRVIEPNVQLSSPPTGSIQRMESPTETTSTSAEDPSAQMNQVLMGVAIHEVSDFRGLLPDAPSSLASSVEAVKTMEWLNKILGKKAV